MNQGLDPLISEQYPLMRTDAEEYQRLINHCRSMLKSTGALALPKFLTTKSIQTMTAQIREAVPGSFRMEALYNPYSEDMNSVDDLSLPPNHPARCRLPASHHTLAGDRLPPDSPLHRLHRDPTFCRFLADALELPALYPVTDHLGGVNVLVYEPGDANGWHFDSVAFVVSIMIQKASSGGRYEFLPAMRSDTSENLTQVALRMQQPDLPDGVRQIVLNPGTLFLFRGKHTLHRVTRIEGEHERVVAILSYHQHPDQQLSEGTRLALYGRTI